ncbi:IclR family transcriptional regulator [Neoroseomonas lacus]|uniref:IclR family transcriptional regulator n=1 Tax=Neoroseomonas lacus TaxID=287609 RepID=A0A917L0Z5_9PROT|nr:IclR family transcriptional regulator [Neoroseomonas lacus]GGJ39494.1 IclR family transcriptional regulator [Neoroseomonas lacus]
MRNPDVNPNPPARRRGRPARTAPPAAEQRVEAVERAFALLEAFADGTKLLTLAELAARAGLYPSTALRLAGSLIRFGYLARGAGGGYRLGPTPFRLGGLYRAGYVLADQVRPALVRLVGLTGETGGFYVRDGDRRICLFREPSPRPIRLHIEEGAAMPLDRGASAHVLMAFSGGTLPVHDTVRAAGVAISIGQRDPEIAAVAAPVFGPAGRLVGALGVSGPVLRLGAAEAARIAPMVVAEAQAVSRLLGA